MDYFSLHLVKVKTLLRYRGWGSGGIPTDRRTCSGHVEGDMVRGVKSYSTSREFQPLVLPAAGVGWSLISCPSTAVPEQRPSLCPSIWGSFANGLLSGVALHLPTDIYLRRRPWDGV